MIKRLNSTGATGCTLRRALTAVALALCTLSTGSVYADAAESVRTAMADPARPATDVARDKNRKPVETLEFFGLKEDMRVLELLPGGGWYTRLLASALKDDGKLYVAIGTQNIEEKLLSQPGFEEVDVVSMEADMGRDEGARRFSVRSLKMDVKRLDMALTFRNLHNFDKAGRKVMNEAVFKALKRGGVYGVVDHTTRHMAPDGSETWRRMDPVQMIKEIQAVGFELVDYSDLHYRPDDELRYEVGRRSVTGNTDRFTLLFRKP